MIDNHRGQADGYARCVRVLDARVVAVIRVDAGWLAVAALEMRSGTELALARVVNVFGSARPLHAYLFANRMKVLVYDDAKIWLAARMRTAITS